jgi:hypothetical protein
MLKRWMLSPFAFLAAACAYAGSAPAPGCDFEAQIAAELQIADAGEGIASSVPDQSRTAEQQQAVDRADAILDSHDRPVSEADVAILDHALRVLAGEAVWDRADDRECGPHDTTFSLFCALQKASIDVLGVYQHRRAALQEVRFAVDEATAGRDYHHRLQDYNNDPTTTLADVRHVIELARQRVADRLAAQRARCGG